MKGYPTYFYMIPGLLLLALVLKLKPVTLLFLTPVLTAELFFWNRKRREQKRQWNRLEDLSLYMELLLYAFLREGKILNALESVETALPRGTLQAVVADAAEFLRMAYDETEVAEKAFEMVEKSCPCRRLRTIHEFMLHVEYYGGDLKEPVRLLLEDKRHWEKRIRQERKERQNMEIQVLLSALMSLLICSTVLYMPVKNMAISDLPLAQFLSAAAVAANGLVAEKAAGFLAVDFVSLEDGRKKGEEADKMKAYRAYDRKKEHGLSLLLGGAGMLAGIFCWVCQWKYGSLLFMLLAILLYHQDKIGYFLLKKRVTGELERAFPEWLLDMALLLQSENVQISLEKSREHAPEILQKELDLFNDRLGMNPESAQPYRAFLEEFHLPQVRTAMSMLYALSLGNMGVGDWRLTELIRTNLEMLDQGENRRLKDQSSGMYLLFLAPVLIGSGILIGDMALYLMTMLSWGVVG